jgi:hypothetical protein
MNLFEYAENIVRGINQTAVSKLKNPQPYMLKEDIEGCAVVTDRGERQSKGSIYGRARVEKAEEGEGFGTWEYHYSPDGCQRTVDWMLSNDPGYFLNHIAGCRNRARGQVLRMDDLQDYATEILFGQK